MQEIIREEQYQKWISELSDKYRNSQIKAAISVNCEMLKFYWELGRDISSLYSTSKWGSSFFSTLSKDLKKKIPNSKCFSPTNLRYMKRFYELFTNFPQVGEDLYNVPWGHIKVIIDKCSFNSEKAAFFVHKVVENNWSRALLLNFLETELFERQGKAITNFENRLPIEYGALAQEITKDPYNFDFLCITEKYNERELKDALLDNIQKFLLELGTGFAFVGREFRIQVGKTEEFIDMLFYNINLHCYVVIEVKTNSFKPGDIGQLGTYVTAVNHIIKGEKDEATIGLLICKTKDNVLAHYATESSSQPIGISEYQLSKMLEENYKGTLPTIEEIEEGLNDCQLE